MDFDVIYRVWFGQVLRWVRRLGGPGSDVEDLAQDVFVIAKRRLEAFDGNNLGGWLYRITQNRVRDYRCLKWFQAVSSGATESPEGLLEHRPDPLGVLETKQNCLRLERQLLRLREAERVSLLLLELDGHSGEEIAEMLGVPLNTVWSRIRRARLKLAASGARLEGRTPSRTPPRLRASA
jgi:RNA polymerase sigma-70 factor (ECF subfamily)